MSEKLLDETTRDNTLSTKKFGYRIIELSIIGGNLFMFIKFVKLLLDAHILLTPFFLFVLFLLVIVLFPVPLFRA